MSDEDSMSETISPARLMPKAQTLPEHHRILNMSAVHHGNTLATIKAHNVRIVGLDRRMDNVEGLRDEISDLKNEIVATRDTFKDSVNRLELSMSSLAGIVAKHGEELVVRKQGVDLKKTIIIAVFGLLGAMATASGGYFWAHTPGGPAYVPPTHAQAVQIDKEYREQDPENLKRVHE
jgi:hypothetical protein